jgi:hypothetical protein
MNYLYFELAQRQGKRKSLHKKNRGKKEILNKNTSVYLRIVNLLLSLVTMNSNLRTVSKLTSGQEHTPLRMYSVELM